MKISRENIIQKYEEYETQRLKTECKKMINKYGQLKDTKRGEIEKMVKAYIQQEYPKITNKKYLNMKTFLSKWDEDIFDMIDGVDFTITYLEDLAKLLCS